MPRTRFVPLLIVASSAGVHAQSSSCNTSFVSTDALGVQSTSASRNPHVSADGRYVAFECDGALVSADTNAISDVYVKDRATGNVVRASVSSNGTECTPPYGPYYQSAPSYSSISARGRFWAFVTEAGKLPPNDANGRPDVFVHDMLAGHAILVSATTAGTSGTGASGVYRIQNLPHVYWMEFGAS